LESYTNSRITTVNLQIWISLLEMFTVPSVIEDVGGSWKRRLPLSLAQAIRRGVLV
jgi:hypothetical protein